MTTPPNKASVQVLPEYVPDDLGAPFKVILKDSVKLVKDAQTGTETIVIPNLRGLLQRVALTRLLIDRKLSGAELKFIRKALGMKQKELARLLDVSPEHMSRVEGGSKILSSQAEKLARIAILLDHYRLPDGVDEAAEKDEALRDTLTKIRSAFEHVRSVLSEMEISPIFFAEDDLVLSFHFVEKPEAKTEEENWTSLPLAA